MGAHAIRPARRADADAVWPLARDFATSFVPTRAAFDATFPALLDRDDTLLAVAERPTGVVGHVLASAHLTFLANGPVCWVEELMVDADHRGTGAGSALVRAVEDWAAERDAAYGSLASRRAGDFYRRLGYADSATFFRKVTRRRG
ncbi:GNAT family N-acetyltransferase [Isoptericola variabilis]|uniref:GCN5-related N-acetyltransferase n=1 Tax=Isoptericola variabilis (strain 225) TaxID=743718 RepID=F6FWY7_ISOV2|nr:GNAT family N-acetyltransferase [Isoptericola variabilis]AEG44587.1 GCN5-related N-acetyltransferase [Isoptericola variabilis 225]TWH28945.1 putative N-acetyltransferase YhbS [Isoptericola variabilis J7]